MTFLAMTGRRPAGEARARARLRVALVFGIAMACASCLDFADPLIPVASSTAQLSATMRVFDQGVFQVDGFLSPGTDSAGFQRTVESPFIQARGITVEPKTLGARGVRNYSTTVQLPPNSTGGPFQLTAPVVRDVGTLPDVLLYGLERVGGDTISVAPGADIELRFVPPLATTSPAAPFRQWFIEVRGAFNTFRISADGIPPTTLRIPRTFIPSGATRADVFLAYLQTASVSSPTRQYSGNVVLDVRMDWVVLFRTTP
jgi:hypothetical protein